MTLKAQMAADAAIFFNADEFGEYVTYNGVEIIAIADIGEGIQRGQVNNNGQAGYFEVQKTDVPNPKVHDIIIDSRGRSWKVNEISAEDETSFVLRTTAGQSAVTGKGGGKPWR